MVLSLAVVVPLGLKLTLAGYLLIILFISPTLIGLWKIEWIEISGEEIRKSNFAGMVTRSFDLKQVVHLTKKLVDNDYPTNPLRMLVFTSRPNLWKYRIAKVKFEDGSTLKFREQGMESKDFKRLYDTIKQYEKINSKHTT